MPNQIERRLDHRALAIDVARPAERPAERERNGQGPRRAHPQRHLPNQGDRHGLDAPSFHRRREQSHGLRAEWSHRNEQR